MNPPTNKFLSIESHVGPGTGSFPRFIDAALTLRYYTFELLLANGRKHIRNLNIELFRNANARRAQLQFRQTLPSFTQRQLRQIAPVRDKKIENKVVNACGLGSEMLPGENQGDYGDDPYTRRQRGWKALRCETWKGRVGSFGRRFDAGIKNGS
jgi:hypothetical protein